jgi:hypothetical protein
VVRAPPLSAVAALLASATLGGCFGNSTTEFPAGLEPLEDNAAPTQQGGAFSETLTMQIEPFTTYNSVHGRGYLLVAPTIAWARSKNPDVMEQGCAVTRHMATVGVEPAYEYGFKEHYEVDNIITVAWDELWRFGTIEGTPEAPTRAMVRYQKVAGTDFIKILEGSVQYYGVPDQPDVTMVEYIEHVNARSSGTSDTMASMQERFDATVAAVHDAPPPACP